MQAFQVKTLGINGISGFRDFSIFGSEDFGIEGFNALGVWSIKLSVFREVEEF